MPTSFARALRAACGSVGERDVLTTEKDRCVKSPRESWSNNNTCSVTISPQRRPNLHICICIIAVNRVSHMHNNINSKKDRRCITAYVQYHAGIRNTYYRSYAHYINKNNSFDRFMTSTRPPYIIPARLCLYPLVVRVRFNSPRDLKKIQLPHVLEL